MGQLTNAFALSAKILLSLRYWHFYITATIDFNSKCDARFFEILFMLKASSLKAEIGIQSTNLFL